MKIAIIGASTGQVKLFLKAKELGYETICFAWEEGAVCKDYSDKFYPISIVDKDAIVEICRKEKIDGVLSNTSELCAQTASYVAEQLNLVGCSYDKIMSVIEKSYVRELSKRVDSLSQVKFISGLDFDCPPFLPCVVKPIVGSGKKGVWFVNNDDEFSAAFDDIKRKFHGTVLIEEYIEGREFSVETISYNNTHYVIQITDKENSGAPHFVELSHHQPASISQSVYDKMESITKQLLEVVGFDNGAAHIEYRMDINENIYLIEINPRGGGCEISNQLVKLSTGYDYLKAMIDVAVDNFEVPIVQKIAYSGIYYLCEQTKNRAPYYNNPDFDTIFVDKEMDNQELRVATGNHDRNGYMLYCHSEKVVI